MTTPERLRPGQPCQWWWPDHPDEDVVGHVVRDDGGDIVRCLPLYGPRGQGPGEDVPRGRITPTP